MLTIQCTKKLTDELTVNMPNVNPLNVAPLYSWHAHLFLFKRRKCVLVMNNRTRYNFLFFGLKKKDFEIFDSLIVDSIKDNLLYDGIDMNKVEEYLQGSDIVSFAPTSDRSIISQINEMIMVSKYYMMDCIDEGTDINIYELNRRLNRFVMMKLPQLYPIEAMKEALEKI